MSSIGPLRMWLLAVTIRQAARNWGIPYPTLRHRLYGTQSRDTAWADYQRLSQAQESSLAVYISTQSALGSALIHQQVKGLAERMIGDTQHTQRPLGRKWMQRFLRRNPSSSTLRYRAINSRRYKAHSAEVIQEWFYRLDLLVVKGIKLANRWNMDKIGILEGKGSNGPVLGSEASRYIQK
ncbi:transposase, partial [Colletotrichum incanum]